MKTSAPFDQLTFNKCLTTFFSRAWTTDTLVYTAQEKMKILSDRGQNVFPRQNSFEMNTPLFVAGLHFSWLCVIVISVDIITLGLDLVLTAKNTNTSLCAQAMKLIKYFIESCRNFNLSRRGIVRKIFIPLPSHSNAPQKFCCAFRSIYQMLLITTASKLSA